MIYHDRTFTNCRVALENNAFRNCRFGVGVTFVVTGIGAPPVMEQCEIEPICSWEFSGPAGNTLRLLASFARMENGGVVTDMVSSLLSGQDPADRA